MSESSVSSEETVEVVAVTKADEAATRARKFLLRAGLAVGTAPMVAACTLTGSDFGLDDLPTGTTDEAPDDTTEPTDDLPDPVTDTTDDVTEPTDTETPPPPPPAGIKFGPLFAARITDFDESEIWGGRLVNIGDFNGDGVDDFASAKYDSGYNDTYSEYLFVVYGDVGKDTSILLDGYGQSGSLTIRTDSGRHGVGFEALDFNGDGLQDLVVNSESSKMFVVFGGSGAEYIDLTGSDDLWPAGITIANTYNYYRMGNQGFEVLDFNGDGMDDFAFVRNNGPAVVIFGTDELKTINVSYGTVAGESLRLQPYYDDFLTGVDFGSGMKALDFNGDGKQDLALMADNDVVVVFGHTATDTNFRNVSTYNGGSYHVLIQNTNFGYEGGNVWFDPLAGDVNGDGKDDLVFDDKIGRKVVVFGGGVGTDPDVGNLGSRGFVIEGNKLLDDSSAFAGDVGFDPVVEYGGGYVGYMDYHYHFHKSVTEYAAYINWHTRSAMADVNGDGKQDILLTTYPDKVSDAKEKIFVVFGKSNTSSVDLASLGSAGQVIEGDFGYFDVKYMDYSTSHIYKGYDSVLGGTVYLTKTAYLYGNVEVRGLQHVGDFNDDGADDLVITTMDNKAFVVFGSGIPGPIDLGSLGLRGIVVDDVPGNRGVFGNFFGDGDLELALRSPDGKTVTVYGKEP